MLFLIKGTSRKKDNVDENTIRALRQLLPALEALSSTLHEMGHSGLTDGAGDMALKSYRSLHAKIAALLPDDDYVTEVLVIEVDPSVGDRQKLAQVQLAAKQLVKYLQSQMRDSRGGFNIGPMGPDFEDLKDMTRNLRDRILAQTKDSIRRAMSDIDIEINLDTEMQHKGKRKVVITSEDELVGANLSGQDLSHRNFSDHDLTSANLSGSNLDHINLSDATLVDANLSGANMTNANASDADFTSANLSGVYAQDANCSDCVFVQANLTGAQFGGANLSDCDFTDADMQGANLHQANLSDSELVNVNLMGANLHQANLRDSEMTGANLEGANLHEANLRDAVLVDVNLRGATMHGANVRDCDFTGATMPDGRRYRDGMDLSPYEVSGSRGKPHWSGTPPVPPVPPTPPVPPVPPTPTEL